MDDRAAELLRRKTRQQYWATTKRTLPLKKYIPSVKKAKDYVVLDFETTGLRPGADQIIQVGAVKFRNHVQIGIMNQLVNPLRSISTRITALTGITNSMVKNEPKIDSVINELIEFIGDLPIVAHNASFDMNFLYALEEKVELPTYTVIDTLKLSRKVFNETPNHKLTTLAQYLQLEHNAHDALGDCLVTAKIYQYCFKHSI
ncbi:3'-5' exonuclease [Paenisporosarcina antarctica]|uniref:3'-5' exonuclease n=1 Tax=Paenisporosarcina antarctica TaxID=417367 RepID=A0A4P6ZZM1_9BACL|nr:3'-5' exonuclease [Paenisporosarcina antarctica]QBP41783.1 3'-5' exonuclease [Paenisporosarcina antarctica]